MAGPIASLGEALAAPRTGSFPTSEVASARYKILTDLNVVASESVPHPAKAGNESAIEMAVVDINGSVSHSGQQHCKL